jgi:hypothetical protein
MRRVFQAVFEAGTSAYWHKDRALVVALSRVYKKLDKELIRPWVDQEAMK